jgi:hypothetical protein
MEQNQTKVKKTRDVCFENVKDPNVKLELINLTNAPKDATNFIFWYSKVNSNEWGLTLKSIPKKTDKEGFPSQHTWKMTWINNEEMEKLQIANHCKSLGTDIQSPASYQKIKDLFVRYRNK